MNVNKGLLKLDESSLRFMPYISNTIQSLQRTISSPMINDENMNPPPYQSHPPPTKGKAMAYNALSSFWDHYRFVKVIGSGASCHVILAVSNQDELVAVKQMKINELNLKLFKNEFAILLSLANANGGCISAPRLKAGFRDDRYLYLVTQYCSGGTLQSYIDNDGLPSVRTAVQSAQLIQRMVDAVGTLHAHGIAHRDLKPQNLVFQNNSPNSPIVICDLADALPVNHPFSDERVTDFVGSLWYVAPESLRPRQKKDLLATDMWAVGVMAYQILFNGRLPFAGDTHRQILPNVIRAQYSFPDAGVANNKDSHTLTHTHTTELGQSFISALLQRDLSIRLTADQCHRHPFIQYAMLRHRRRYSNPLTPHLTFDTEPIGDDALPHLLLSPRRRTTPQRRPYDNPIPLDAMPRLLSLSVTPTRRTIISRRRRHPNTGLRRQLSLPSLASLSSSSSFGEAFAFPP